MPTGGYLEQADGTAWMALFCQNMLEIAAELAMTDPDYEDMALKFCEHFLWIASAMAHLGRRHGHVGRRGRLLLRRAAAARRPGPAAQGPVHGRPAAACAATMFDGELIAKNPELAERFQWFLAARPELYAAIHDPSKPGVAGRRLASILDETKLRRVLAKMLDENEFLSPYGLRSLSRYHADHPYVIHAGGQEYRVSYLPAESDTGMFGGNSNWRGPIWMPVNALIIRALLQYYSYYGDDFTVECPTGSGRQMNLYQVAEEIARRLANIFLKDKDGRRPVYGGTRKFQDDPHWRDCILFYEYFHGDNGAGLGASHQTGWTGSSRGHAPVRDLTAGAVPREARRPFRWIEETAQAKSRAGRIPHGLQPAGSSGPRPFARRQGVGPGPLFDDRGSSIMKKLGLALSGGGFRATLYHLGLVRFLRDAGILPQVTHITSVSGGSIMAAHLVLNWDRYNGSPKNSTPRRPSCSTSCAWMSAIASSAAFPWGSPCAGRAGCWVCRTAS